jgi:UDP-2-acetamido-2-deoxy-ribo-hexuluronate aminotransferase
MVDHRDHVQASLKSQGIPTAVHYPTPLHRQPAFSKHCCPDCLPHTDAVAQRVLSLPMSADLTQGDQVRVIGALSAACREAA